MYCYTASNVQQLEKLDISNAQPLKAAHGLFITLMQTATLHFRCFIQ